MKKTFIKFAVLVKFLFEDGSSSYDLLIKRTTPYALERYGSLVAYSKCLLSNCTCEVLKAFPIDTVRIDYEF